MKYVLVADDDPWAVAAIVRTIHTHAVLTVCCSAELAAAQLVRQQFDLVISDYDMGGANGLWLLGEVGRLQPAARRVLLSGSPHASTEAEALKLDRVLTKPVDRETLLSLVGG